jgi:hypothetical protein
VLVTVGGIGPESATLIRGANAAGLRADLATLTARFANEGWNKSDRLIVYVSADASSGELHLRGSRFPVADLRRFVEERIGRSTAF